MGPFDIFRIVRNAVLAAACVAAPAAFGATYYVDGSVGTTGDGSELSPFKTLPEGVAAATTADDVVEVAEGTYTLTAMQTLSKAIIIRGTAASRDDVIVSGGGSVTCFKITGAMKVENMTIANGKSSAGQSGGCINASAACVISNCVIKGGAIFNSGCAIAAYLDGGAKLVDCKVCNNSAYFNGVASGGLVVEIRNGSMVRTLVVSNSKSNTINYNDSIVRLYQGTIDHCTIANNSCALSALSVIDWASCTVKDTIVWGNTSLRDGGTGAPNVSGIGTKAKVSHLCTSYAYGTDPLVDNPSFVDQTGGDYSLSAASPCIGAGTDGSDIGAIPYDSSTGTVGMRVSALGGNDSVAVTHTLVAGGGWTLSGATVRWAFDGRTLGADEAGDASGTSATHTYMAGLHSPAAYVRLAGAAEDVVVKLPKTIDVRWTGTAYVDDDSTDPIAPYDDPNHAAKSLMDVVPTAADGATVSVAEGTYALTACLNLVRNVKIVGSGACDKTLVTSGSRCFYLGNSNAELKNLTLTGTGGCFGPGLWLASGAASNCWVKSCWCSQNAGNGSLWMTGGRFTHGKVTNGGCTGYGAGIGVYMTGGTVANSLILSNKPNTPTVANSKGGGVYISGGTLVNCTISDNTGYQGGGVYQTSGGSIRNCLIYGNTSSSAHSSGSKQIYGSASSFCNCCFDVSYGVDTQVATSAPYDSTTYEIDPASGSMCINTGNNDYVDETSDYFGNARIFDGDGKSLVDIGAHEYSKVEIVPGFTVTPLTVTGEKPVTFTATVQGAEIEDCVCTWYLDGSSTPSYVGATYSVTLATGAHRARLVLTTGGKDYEVESTDAQVVRVYPLDCYADAASTTAKWPFDSWDTAASNLNEVVTDALRDGGTLHVAAGDYPVSKSVAIGKGMRLLGAGCDRTCVYATGEGYSVVALNGVGAYVECICASNGTNKQGAGVHVSGDGGHFTRGKITKCKGQTNWSGGGAFITGSNSKISRTVICENQTHGLEGKNDGHQGGGVAIASEGVLEDCLVISNHADNAAGVILNGGYLRNCTIVGNHAYCNNGRTSGCIGVGGVYAGYTTASVLISNCIICDNLDDSAPTPPDASLNVGGEASYFKNLCSPVAFGTACVTDDPRFVDTAHGDYRILSSSPCRYAGTYQTWMATATDFYGNPRAIRRHVDIGCHQTQRSGLAVFVP